MSSRDPKEFLGPELGAQLAELASNLGLTKAGYLRALFVGSHRLGLAERCVLSAIDEGWIDAPRESPDRDMPLWTSTTVNPSFSQPGFIPHKAAVWVRGGFRLDRLDPPSRTHKDRGWVLTGPGIDAPIPVGHRTHDAKRKANEIIRDMSRT